MRLKRLKIENTKLLRSFRWPLADEAEIGAFTIFVGENGLCKTTILQAIALAAAGPTGANQLASAGSFRDRRPESPSDDALISARFSVSQAQHSGREYPGFLERLDTPPEIDSKIRVAHGWTQFDGDSAYWPAREETENGVRAQVGPMEEIRGRDLPLWFVAAYGMSRVLPSAREIDVPDTRSIPRLRSLFKPEPLIATGFSDILAKLFGDDLSRAYAKTLRDVLVGDESAGLPGLFPGGDDLPRVDDIELRGRGGARSSAKLTEIERIKLRVGDTSFKVPATWLSQGYQGTMAWVADLIGQVFLEAGQAIAPREIEGLVLIDEIDLHLHPRWQAVLVRALKQTFPGVQFIATTHSPMVLPGAAEDEIAVLRLSEGGDVNAHPAPFSPALKTGSEIYEGFFGIHELYPAALGRALRDFSWLANDPERSPEDDARMEALRKQLADAGVDPGWEPEPRKTSEGAL